MEYKGDINCIFGPIANKHWKKNILEIPVSFIAEETIQDIFKRNHRNKQN